MTDEWAKQQVDEYLAWIRSLSEKELREICGDLSEQKHPQEGLQGPKKRGYVGRRTRRTRSGFGRRRGPIKGV